MLFNSYEFIFLFLPITFILYFYLLSQRLILGAKIFLVIASLFFYGYWNFSYVPLILLSIFVNYSVGLSLVNHEKIKLSSKTILIFGILFNVGLLGYFKYTDFLLENFNCKNRSKPDNDARVRPDAKTEFNRTVKRCSTGH